MTPLRYGVNYGAGVPFGTFSQPEMLLWAQSLKVRPLAFRVLFAAMSRMGPSIDSSTTASNALAAGQKHNREVE